MNAWIRLTLVLGVVPILATACAAPNSASGIATLPAASLSNDVRLSPPPPPRRVRIRLFSDLPGPRPYYFPNSVAAAAGKLWVIDSVDQDYGLCAIVGIATSGKRTNVFHAEYGTGPSDIVDGPDGALWMADSYGENIVRMTVRGKFTYNSVAPDSPYNLTTGPDDALWFTAETGSGGIIGRMTTQGAVTTFAAPAETVGIATGSDGALWFTEPYANRIGRITTSGTITEYSKGIDAPQAIASGPDGALWFTESPTGAGGPSAIGRITTRGHVTVYSKGIAPLEHPIDIAAGPDNAMWFTETEFQSNTGAAIGRISMNGKITHYSKNLDPRGSPSGITAGPDGRMWFAESDADRMGRVTP